MMECERLQHGQVGDMLRDLAAPSRSEGELVCTVRSLRANNCALDAQELCLRLLERCEPVFQTHVRGLAHMPAVREDALASMRERVLREIYDPKELFLSQNFFHAVHCICLDVFKGALRGERKVLVRPGKDSKMNQWYLARRNRDVQDVSITESDLEILDERDPYEHILALEEVSRLLHRLPDELDRYIVVLRAIEEKKWKEIAARCRLHERTVRYRYEAARKRLRLYLQQEMSCNEGIARRNGQRPHHDEMYWVKVEGNAERSEFLKS